MNENSKSYLTINTHKGLYSYNRLVFGIAASPSIWQRTMDQVLKDIPNTSCILDDIIITGKSDEEHLKTLETVLQRLQDYNLRAHVDKCSFFREEITYCWHKINANGLHKTQEKIEAVINAPVPENVTQLRAFLGLVNYYSHFLPNMASVLHPLYQLLKKDKKYTWTTAAQNAFDTVKEMITSDTVLTHYNPELPLKLSCDSSSYGLGAVISHVMENGEERPIAFASRTLNAAEKNYAQIQKEALSIIWGVKKFHCFLFGRKFTLVTDHQPLISSEEFQTFCRNNGIIHKTSAPWHPATQGLVERFVQTFKLAMKSASTDGGSLHQKIGSFLLQYRNAAHATTNESPAKLFLGRQLRSRLDLIKPNIRDTVEKIIILKNIYKVGRYTASKSQTLQAFEQKWAVYKGLIADASPDREIPTTCTYI